MRIRTKLLLLLLVLVLPPLVLISVYAVWDSRNLGQKLADDAEDALVQAAKKELMLSVELIGEDMIDHWQGQERLLALLAKQAGHLLSVQAVSRGGVIFDGETDERNKSLSNHDVDTLSIPMLFHAPQGSNKQTFMNDAQRLTGLASLFSVLVQPDSDFKAQVLVRLNSGLTCYSRGSSGVSNVPESMYTDNSSVKDNHPRRRIKLDKTNGLVSYELYMPITLQDGAHAGIAEIEEPLWAVGPYSDLSKRFGVKMSSMLLEEASHPDGRKGLRIVGERGALGRVLCWKVPSERRWLDFGSSKVAKETFSHILAGRSGVEDISSPMVSGLVAFKPLSGSGLVLMVQLPRDAVLSHAERAENAIIKQAWRILSVTAFIALATIGIVTVLAFVISRSVTRPVADLAAAANRLATGDTSASVAARGHDELSDLSRAFNAMVPQLTERLALKHDLELAKEVQQNLLPHSMPTVPGLDIAAASVFCDETGGDYYDFIELSRQDGTVCDLVIGDATGHGISAALLMATSRALMRGKADAGSTVGALLSETNALLCRDTDLTGRFITLFYLRLEKGGREPGGNLIWARAGHDPAVIFDPATGTFIELNGRGISLGVSAEYAYDEYSRPGLKPGQVLVMATDGLWEARNHEGEMFGKQRFLEMVQCHSGEHAEDLVMSLIREVRKFQADLSPDDDMTLVAVKALA